LFAPLEALGLLSDASAIDVGCVHRIFVPLVRIEFATYVRRFNNTKKRGYAKSRLAVLCDPEERSPHLPPFIMPYSEAEINSLFEQRDTAELQRIFRAHEAYVRVASDAEAEATIHCRNDSVPPPKDPLQPEARRLVWSALSVLSGGLLPLKNGSGDIFGLYEVRLYDC